MYNIVHTASLGIIVTSRLMHARCFSAPLCDLVFVVVCRNELILFMLYIYLPLLIHHVHRTTYKLRMTTQCQCLLRLLHHRYIARM